MRIVYTRTIRAYAEHAVGTRNGVKPAVKLAFADGGLSGHLQMRVEQAEELLFDLEKAVGEVREWQRLKDERDKIRAARKAGITLPLADDQPMIEDDGLALVVVS